MKKYSTYINLIGLMFLAFGITDLDFENPSLQANMKAYAASAVGAVFLILSFFQKKKESNR